LAGVERGTTDITVATYIVLYLIYNYGVDRAGASLRAARARLGLTQAQAADLLATSQANVSAYESGRLRPGRVVAERIDAFAALAPDSVYAAYSASTVPSTAAAIRTDLAQDRSESDMLRIVIQASDGFARLTEQDDRDFFLTEPSPTRSRRWDALIAGLAVHLCRVAGMDRTPMWTTDPSRVLDDIWWFGRSHDVVGMRSRSLREAIPSMRARGVMFGRANLESV
jgi:transcriptional regulator with XRE-family HTH domain